MSYLENPIKPDNKTLMNCAYNCSLRQEKAPRPQCTDIGRNKILQHNNKISHK